MLALLFLHALHDSVLDPQKRQTIYQRFLSWDQIAYSISLRVVDVSNCIIFRIKKKKVIFFLFHTPYKIFYILYLFYTSKLHLAYFRVPPQLCHVSSSEIIKIIKLSTKIIKFIFFPKKAFRIITNILRKNHFFEVQNGNSKSRSSHSKAFLVKYVLEICSKFTGEHPCRSVISVNLLCDFIEITLKYWCSSVNLLQISRTPFSKNISGWLLLEKVNVMLKKT